MRDTLREVAPGAWESEPLELVDAPPPAEDFIARIKARMDEPAVVLIAGLLAQRVESARRRCDELGSPWPMLSSEPEDASIVQAANAFYFESCKYTVALLLPAGNWKYAPVAVCGAGQIAAPVTVKIAEQRAAAAEKSDAVDAQPQNGANGAHQAPPPAEVLERPPRGEVALG